ncbi:MAG: GNAT family N-acetyltransferase [Ignavibacterium sp.]|nr:GNAT family N-acetyltransferase [Ignavibacterium sp.]
MKEPNPEITKDIIIQSVIYVLKKFDLQPKDYIHVANALLDMAINPKSDTHHKKFEKVEIKSKKLPVSFEDITIREINLQKDKQKIMEWIENIQGRDFFLSRIDDIEIATDAIIKDPKHIFGLVLKDGEPIGIMGYMNYDTKNRKAELRKIIGELDYRGKGYGKKATNLWLSFGIQSLNLRKIYLYTFDTDVRNIRINLDMGFQLEGIFRQENLYSDGAKDILRMAFLVEE